ncbi:MAG: pyridoxal-phosphate dependent enzyme [Bacteroidota bacterium]
MEKLWRLAADTRLQVIGYRCLGGPEQQVLVKCEQYTPTGNSRYRLALYILQKAYELGQLRPGDHLMVAGAGDSALAYAAIARALAHPVRVFMPAGDRPLVAQLQSYGAEVVQEPDLLTCRERVRLMQHHDGVFLPHLLNGPYAIAAYEHTAGREIGHQLLLNRLHPDAFIAAAGTGATVLGIGKYLSRLYPNMLVHPLHVPGVDGDSRYPELSMLNKMRVIEPRAVPDLQQQLNDLGLNAGPIAAANLLGAIELQQQLAPRSLVVTVFPDSAGHSPPVEIRSAVCLTGCRIL